MEKLLKRLAAESVAWKRALYVGRARFNLQSGNIWWVDSTPVKSSKIALTKEFWQQFAFATLVCSRLCNDSPSILVEAVPAKLDPALRRSTIQEAS